VAALTAIAVAPAAFAGSGTDRATGGGQYVVGSSDFTGAGSTISFTAQGTASKATGEVQSVLRSGGTGQGGQATHYDVTCLLVTGSFADIEGHEKGGTAPFTLYVLDNGAGTAPGESDTDGLMFSQAGNQVCDETDSRKANEALARGNAQVYDAP
jgi:hypothetical protein